MKKYFGEDIPRRKFMQMSLKGGVAMAATPSLMMHLLSCKGKGEKGAALSLNPALINKTISKALEKGGEFADVYI